MSLFVNIENDTEENTEKHFVIKYTHKESKRECIVIIGTIDSFCYNLSIPNTRSCVGFGANSLMSGGIIQDTA